MPPKKPNRGRGRPAEIGAAWKRSTTILREDQLVKFADLDIRMRGTDPLTQPLSRGEVIRALIDAMFSSDIDVTKFKNEHDLRAALTARMRGKGKK
jgi:hypothetical protein